MKRIFVIIALLPLLAMGGQNINTEGHRKIFTSATSYMFTSFALGTLRNNFFGTVGMKFTAPAASPPTIKSICRWNVAGNSQTHSAYLFDVTSSTVIASVSIDATLGTAGTNQCVAITPSTLTASHVYTVGSCENSGGDQWYDQDTIGTFDSAFGTGAVSDILNNGGCAGGEAGSGVVADAVFGPANLTR